MPTADMVQVHLLTAYPASLLNRDDAGLAKRIPFGGTERVRISSQCLKKHWREAPHVSGMGELAVRSTRIYEELVARALEEKGASAQEASAIARFLMSETVETKPAKDKKTGAETARSGQLLVLTRAETRFLAERGMEILAALREAGVTAADSDDVKKAGVFDKKQWGSTLKGLPASLDTAMFGRMVTSDLFARVDAAVSVAHAFTTHAAAAENDYFTAVDTLKTDEDDAGAGLINETELTSGVFYTYAVIDMNQLRANLGEQAGDAEKLARALVEAMATVSPGAKRGSTAPYSRAELVLIERGGEQPRTLANAFLKPVGGKGGGLMEESVNALLERRGDLDGMYEDTDGLATLSTIHDVPKDVRAEKVPFRVALGRIFRAPGE
jgi:CRISPR system Cascade subunit CasC